MFVYHTWTIALFTLTTSHSKTFNGRWYLLWISEKYQFLIFISWKKYEIVGVFWRYFVICTLNTKNNPIVLYIFWKTLLRAIWICITGMHHYLFIWKIVKKLFHKMLYSMVLSHLCETIYINLYIDIHILKAI